MFGAKKSIRMLKIYYSYQNGKTMSPLIRLQGRWLQSTKGGMI